MSVYRRSKIERTGCGSPQSVSSRTWSRGAGRWHQRRRQWPSGWHCSSPLIVTLPSVSRGESPTSPRIDDTLVLPSALFYLPPSSTTSRDTSSVRFTFVIIQRRRQESVWGRHKLRRRKRRLGEEWRRVPSPRPGRLGLKGSVVRPPAAEN